MGHYSKRTPRNVKTLCIIRTSTLVCVCKVSVFTLSINFEAYILTIIFFLDDRGSDQQGVDNTRRYLLEWLSFLHRYIPVGIYESNAGLNYTPKMNERPPSNIQKYGRTDLEMLMMSSAPEDWKIITEMLLGPTSPDFRFEPKHKSKSYSNG